MGTIGGWSVSVKPLEVIARYCQNKTSREHVSACVPALNTKSCDDFMPSNTSGPNGSHSQALRKRRGPTPKPNVRTKHELYSVWMSMRARCNNPHVKCYKHYGGRGIQVCARWDEFWLFVKDMGPRPTPKHELDRKDNNGHYEPSNCHWVTRREQLQNTRRNKLISFGGETLTLAAWGRKLGLPNLLINARLRSGWSVARALTSPVGPQSIRYGRTP